MNIGLDTLYQDLRPLLVGRIVRIVQCRETAKDIVQESYLTFIREQSSKQLDNPKGYLYKIALNLAYDHLKHQKIIRNHALISSPDETNSQAIDDEFTMSRRLEQLRQIITELSPRCQEVFTLHKIEGYSYAEVAKALNISESAVQKHMMKGLVYIRQRIKNE